MDIYSPYISLVKSIFPKAEIVLDKFHIVNLVNRAFNQTRISIMNSLKDESLKRKLKLFWKLLQKYYPDLCQEPYYCPSFKYKLSTKDKVDYLLEKISEFYLQLVKRSDLKYMESDIKVYAKKYSNTWGVIQDYTINNAIYKYLGFGYGPELMR